MSQPTYTAEQVMAMSNQELADDLRNWAYNRESLNPRRLKQGKEPLHTLLLHEAAFRLEDK